MIAEKSFESTNLLLHLTAVAHAAGCTLPTVDDWSAVNREIPRLVSVLPNGPVHHPTVRVFLAGGVPEVMLHLRTLGMLDESVLTATGETLKDVLDWWETSERRAQVRNHLQNEDGINPDDVIMSPRLAKERGLTPTVTFPTGNIAPEGSVVKSTSIDPTVIDKDGVYRHTGKAKVFTTEASAMDAIKKKEIQAGDVMVLAGRGPTGSGMEETAQLTAALKYLPFGKHVCLITDARFSGFSTGACIGHVGPEALDGGPIGKLRNGDIIEVIIDLNKLTGSLNFIGEENQLITPTEGTAILDARAPHPELAPDPNLPDDTRLWAALQSISGGTWKGSVYDIDRILSVIEAGKEAIKEKNEQKAKR